MTIGLVTHLNASVNFFIEKMAFGILIDWADCMKIVFNLNEKNFSVSKYYQNG